ncbi:MAG TPA: S8 family peptidase [Vicinamibacterales bacterium]|jgi:subtilisin family serine protease|nr:S8 family peptidase [Vicinamibacterales bacterium]
MHLRPVLAAAAALAAVTLGLVPASAQRQTDPLGQRVDRPKMLRKGPQAIAQHYIVVLDEDAAGQQGNMSRTASTANEMAFRAGGEITNVYAHAINGFSARMSDTQAVALSEDPRVRFVEEDSMMFATATQTNPPWGLDRIGQRDLPLNQTYSYTSTGSGVNVYIIDTGIRTTHTQFGGRASKVFDSIGDGQNGNDCNGHGTHVSGTVGGSTYGVAKAVRLFAVRVLSCSGSGSNSGVIAGVDWVTANHVSPAVANMSLGGGVSTALDTAVRNSIASGVTYAIAAGNSNINAANASPARVSEAITVGASTSSDARASFSNFGSVVDIFAPGVGILSAWRTSDTATNTISGTSMATPHVAGVAARYLQNNRTASPATVRNAIVNAATLNHLSGLPTGTANRLLFWSSAQ